MRITKVLIGGQPRWITVEQGKYYLLDGDIPTDGLRMAEEIKIDSEDDLEFANPFWGRNVVGLAYNYKSLVGKAHEHEEPLIFLKSANSPCANKCRIVYPAQVEKAWVEVELVIVIGRQCSKVSPRQARDYIFGFTIGSDITADNILKRDHHLARSKAIDKFGPVGPYIITDLDTRSLKLRTYINNKLFQQGNTSDRILGDAESVSLISQFIMLFPGDLIFTGTPAGAMESLVRPGDAVLHTIENIGELSFRFVEKDDTQKN